MSKANLRMELSPPEDGCPYWIINFPDLFVGAQGKTLPEVFQNALVALKMWVDDCYERGTLDDALRESGLDELCFDALKEAVSTQFLPITNHPFISNRCRA